MSELEEALIYDAMRSIQRNSQAIIDAVKGDKPASEAYKCGMYAPCIKLQMALGAEAMERGRIRYEEIDRRAKEFFAKP